MQDAVEMDKISKKKKKKSRKRKKSKHKKKRSNRSRGRTRDGKNRENKVELEKDPSVDNPQGHFKQRSRGISLDQIKDRALTLHDLNQVHSHIKKDDRSGNHYLSLFIAFLSMLVQLGDNGTDFLIIFFYYANGHKNAASGIIAIWFVKTLTMMAFDILNHNRPFWKKQIWYFIFDIFQVRVIVEMVKYYARWKKHRGKRFKHKAFMQAKVFETFIGPMASLIVQTHVMIEELNEPTTLQIVSFVFTWFAALLDLLDHFKYLSLSGWTYVGMMLKAIFNTAFRTPLVALLIVELRGYAICWAIFSYTLGLLLYYANIRESHIHKRTKNDRPIKHVKVHLVFAHHIATEMCFIAFPFAPNHSIHSWWFGYLTSETKMQIENVAFLLVVAQIHEIPSTGFLDANTIFYAAVFFVVSMLILNFSLLTFLHHYVSRQLHDRDAYTNSDIIRLFEYLCKPYHNRLVEDKEARRSMQRRNSQVYDQKAEEMNRRKRAISEGEILEEEKSKPQKKKKKKKKDNENDKADIVKEEKKGSNLPRDQSVDRKKVKKNESVEKKEKIKDESKNKMQIIISPDPTPKKLDESSDDLSELDDL